jgi:hypothetical protein
MTDAPSEEMGFRATLRQHYKLTDTSLLVLEEDYRGDIGPGDELRIVWGEHGARCVVQDLAWGSALNAARMPLSLVVSGLGDAEPDPGASIETTAARPASG